MRKLYKIALVLLVIYIFYEMYQIIFSGSALAFGLFILLNFLAFIIIDQENRLNAHKK